MERLGPGARYGFTPSGPAATVYNGTSYLFVRGTDNKIYQNVLTNTHWSGWRQVPGNGLTLSRPGATVYQNRLYLFVAKVRQQDLPKRAHEHPLERLAAGTRQRLDLVRARSHGLSKQAVPVRARDRQQDLPERAHEPLERLGRGNRQRLDPVWPRSHGLSNRLYLFVQGTDSRIYQNVLTNHWRAR